MLQISFTTQRDTVYKQFINGDLSEVMSVGFCMNN